MPIHFYKHVDRNWHASSSLTRHLLCLLVLLGRLVVRPRPRHTHPLAPNQSVFCVSDEIEPVGSCWSPITGTGSSLAGAQSVPGHRCTRKCHNTIGSAQVRFGFSFNIIALSVLACVCFLSCQIIIRLIHLFFSFFFPSLTEAIDGEHAAATSSSSVGKKNTKKAFEVGKSIKWVRKKWLIKIFHDWNSYRVSEIDFNLFCFLFFLYLYVLIFQVKI